MGTHTVTDSTDQNEDLAYAKYIATHEYRPAVVKVPAPRPRLFPVPKIVDK